MNRTRRPLGFVHRFGFLNVRRAPPQGVAIVREAEHNPPPMMFDAAGSASRRWDAEGTLTGRVGLEWLALGGVLTVAVAASGPDDWRPPVLVAALAVAMLVGEFATVTVRSVRMSSGLLVQTTIMALLGPGPAATIGVCVMLVDWRVSRLPAGRGVNNLLVCALVGLLGALQFEALRIVLAVDRTDALYAFVVMPVYAVLTFLELALVAEARGHREILVESGVPAVPLELVKGVFAMSAVLVWGRAGLAAAATLVFVLAVTLPLARTLADALRRSDDLVVLRRESDERAAEVAGLASDRKRLLSEVMDAERRERARLAESLHDGPMQRLAAIRQDAAEVDATLAAQLDEAIAETRALISAHHPAMARELGFEAALRAAIAPFPAAASVALTVHLPADEAATADSLLLPIAQELVVNAVKHADPTAIDIRVHAESGRLALEVNDDGVGIDADSAGRAVQAGHVGLAIVRRRVQDAGGQFEIATRPDGGTRSLTVLPA